MASDELVRLALDVAAVERVAHLLGVPARLEPYTVRGAPVFRLGVRNPTLGTEVALILWPSLARVEVRLADSIIVLKDVDEVLLYPGVEVMFRRREPPAMLFVSVHGRFGLSA
ncbi:MAG: hypothetical protein C4290_08795 [Chloroflexota bacterium]